jgi:protein tyrosine phosphatase (PTP) superfamily phosphohydrolase (DUF442 family)
MNYSKITDSLYIGTTPRAKDYDLLRTLGIELVINMRFGFPPARDLFSSPMKSLWLPVIDSPLFPIPIRMLQAGAQAALKVIEGGGVVYAHCTKGRHRGPVMGACILIAQGMPADAVMDLIKQQRPIADLHAWYIQGRINKFAQKWGQES